MGITCDDKSARAREEAGFPHFLIDSKFFRMRIKLILAFGKPRLI